MRRKSKNSSSELPMTGRRRESPRASSTYTPLFTAALTVPASSNPLNRSNAPKIRRRPTNYYGASFGVNPYKRDRLKRPINRNLAPSVSLPDPASAAIVVASGGNGAKRVRVDDQEEESAAKLILETLEDMTPPPTSLLPLEPSFAPINPYERLIPASAAPTPKQMPASGKRAKTDAVLRDVKAVVAKAEPKSVLLNAKITDRVKSSGTPAKPPAKNTGKLKPGKIDDVSRPLSPSNTTGPSPSTTSFPIISPPKQVQPPLPVAPLSSFANHLTESGPTSKFPVFGSHNADSDSQKPSQPTFTFTFKAETPKPAVLPISEGPKPGWSEKADSSSQSVDFPSILKEVFPNSRSAALSHLRLYRRQFCAIFPIY
ncbi:hypothetical protein DFJ73DRAFT_174695 [Zopfochytrium polystomum]|nr:hypothetical protein DFJ73DRAFT_174695 [Zopfochytrium polystomum]